VNADRLTGAGSLHSRPLVLFEQCKIADQRRNKNAALATFAARQYLLLQLLALIVNSVIKIKTTWPAWGKSAYWCTAHGGARAHS
jgi:uncharacterized protein (DUF427 family)